MKRVLTRILLFSLMLVLCFAGVAQAVGSIDAIHQATNIQELEQAMRDAEEMADEMTQFDALTYSEQYDILTDLMVRKNKQESMDDFKSFFAKVTEDATTYMHFAEGYPYITDEDAYGATLVVKTDISGYVYVITLRDDIVGGITDHYDFMKYYKADNGENKTRVWVRAGEEKRIPLPGEFGSGLIYRTYICLKQDGNVTPQMAMVKYRVDLVAYTFDYTYRISIHHIGSSYIRYALHLTASEVCDYSAFVYKGPPDSSYLDGIDHATCFWPNTMVLMNYYDTYDYEVMTRVEATLTLDDGSTYHDTLYFPGPLPSPEP